MFCVTCGSTEFSVHGGIFYCIECSTQIEETRDEVTEEISFNRKSLVSSPTVERTSKKRGAAVYSKWITAEAYNLIIHQQVCALINLGASQSLKATVLHIWSKYLQKCEVVFREDYRALKGDDKPCLGPVPPKRDIKVLYGDQKVFTSKKKKEKSKKSKGVNVSDENTESSEGTSDSDTNTPISTKKSKPEYSTFVRKLIRNGKLNKRNKVIHSKDVYNMNLRKTLSFCYLGLLYTEDSLSLCDIRRLAFEENIPYINVIDKLSSSLKLQDADHKTFLSYSVPDADEIHKTAIEIKEFLLLPEHKDPPIYFAVSRILKVLNLPDDMKPMVKTLFEKFKIEVLKYSIKLEKTPTDYLATAFILVILKMLFIFDGRFENEHTEIMMKANTIKPDLKYFIWSEWKEQARLKEFLFMTKNPGYCNINKFDSLSADRIISRYPYTQLQPPSSEDLLKLKSRTVSKGEVKSILSNIVSISNNKEQAMPTSFSMRSAINSVEKEWRTLPMYRDTKEIDFNVLKKDFSSHSLSYNPFQFDEENELSYFLMASLYPLETTTEPYCHFLKEGYSKCMPLRTSSAYWFVKTAHNKRKHTQASSDWMNDVPAIFNWLINYICKCTYLSCFHLYYYMVEIEKLLFIGRKSLRSSKNKMLIDYCSSISKGIFV